MKNTIYKYFFHEFLRYFSITIFALSLIVWTVQSVNFLDLVTEDGHAFKTYFAYSILTLSKILTKLIPFSFLVATIMTILKFEKDNELIIFWTSGLNKIYIVNLILRKLQKTSSFYVIYLKSALNIADCLTRPERLPQIQEFLKVENSGRAVAALAQIELELRQEMNRVQQAIDDNLALIIAADSKPAFVANSNATKRRRL